MAKLRVLKGPDAGKVFELSKGVNMVGRDAKCIVRLQDTEISRNHAELFWGPEGFRLRDLGSFNGSHVNCKQVK
ncbi:MAG: FHA domain-containing protein, partial [Gemmataceae bacterium]